MHIPPGGGTTVGSTITTTSNVGSDLFFTVGNLPPHYVVTSDNYSPVAGQPVNLSAQLYDGNNAPWALAGNVVQWTQTDASLAALGTFTGGVATTTSATDASGIATIVFTTSTVAGRSTQIIGTDATTPSPSPVPAAGTSPAITTVFGPDNKLIWGTQPVGAPVGSPMQPFTVQIQDINGNLTNNSTSTVTIQKNIGGTGPGVLSGLTAVASGGVATFSASSFSAPGTYSLIASSGSLTLSPASNTFTITANTVSTLATGSTISALPTSIGAGGSSTITVQAADASGNLITTGGLTVTFHTNLGNIGTTTDHSDGTYSAVLTNTTLAGTATVTFSISGIAPDPAANSVQVIFTPGVLDHFLVEKSGGGPIPDQATTTAFLIQVTAQDINNNTVTSFTGASNTVDLTSAGPLTVVPLNSGAFTNGVKTGISVTINNTGTFHITATQHGGTLASNSNDFNVNASGLDRYSIADGDWTNTATWAYSANASSGGAPIPTVGTPVHIVNGRTVTVSTAGAACGILDFPAGSANSNILTITSGGSLTTGAISIPNAGSGYSNTLDANAGSLTATSISFPYTASVGSQSMTISTGSVTVSGSVTTTTGSVATVSISGAGTLTIGGNFFNTGTAQILGFNPHADGNLITSPGSTVIYNGGGAQSVKGGVVYYNLALSNSGLKTFENYEVGSAGGVIADGVLSFTGTATMAIKCALWKRDR